MTIFIENDWVKKELADNPDHPTNMYISKGYVTDPSHGGKVTCHKCGGFIGMGMGTWYRDHQHANDFPNTWFHDACYNPYEHYYGLDKLID